MLTLRERKISYLGTHYLNIAISWQYSPLMRGLPPAAPSLCLCQAAAVALGSEVVEYSVMQSESGEPLWLVARREVQDEP